MIYMILRGVFVLMYLLASVTWKVLSYILSWAPLASITRTESSLTLPVSEGGRQPRFFEGSYAQARTKSKEQHKFLLIYLHSRNHGDTPRFCRETLCTELVASFLEENFILWGGDISSSEPYKLSHQLNVTKYPYFAVLTNAPYTTEMAAYLQSLNYNKRLSQSGTTLLFKIEGYVNSTDLLRILTDTLEKHQPILFASKTIQEERDRNRILLEQQDREYRESEERDRQLEIQLLERQREEQLRIAKEIEKEESRMREEREKLEKIKREEEQRMEREKIHQAQANRILQTLPLEPDSGDNTTQLVIRLTDGTRVQRRFLNTDTLELVVAFVSTKENFEKKVLATHFPKTVLKDLKMTLKEAGLCPKATIFVSQT